MVENRITFLIGRGSRLPNILNKILGSDLLIQILLVVSHKKLEEDGSDVPGIAEAKKREITAVYWNWVQMKAMGITRENYMQLLGAFIVQEYYRPNFILMTGWDLVLDENFTKFFRSIPILNVHPHPLPDTKDPQDKIKAPDGIEISVLRGTGVWTQAIEEKLPWSGVTIHQVIPGKYDVGPVVAREWLKVEPRDTAQTLREKLNEIEDRLVPETLLKIAKGEINF